MIYTFLANGFEEIEALATVDILRRAKIRVVTMGVGSQEITGAGGIKVICDRELDEMPKDIDGIILPGGMPGAENLFKSDKVKDIIDYCIKNDKLISAICAAPMILGRMGILKNKKACCYPGFEKELDGANIVEDSVCVDGKIITAKGPGASFDFAFAIVKALLGENAVLDLRESMQCT